MRSHITDTKFTASEFKVAKAKCRGGSFSLDHEITMIDPETMAPMVMNLEVHVSWRYDISSEGECDGLQYLILVRPLGIKEKWQSLKALRYAASAYSQFNGLFDIVTRRLQAMHKHREYSNYLSPL